MVKMVRLLATANLKIKGRRSIPPPEISQVFSEIFCISIIPFISFNFSGLMGSANSTRIFCEFAVERALIFDGVSVAMICRD